MRGWEQGQTRPEGIKALFFAVLAVVGLAVLGCVVYFIGSLLDEPQPQMEETLGSLDGRFAPDMTLVVDNKEYAYYNNYFTNIHFN